MNLSLLLQEEHLVDTHSHFFLMKPCKRCIGVSILQVESTGLRE